MTIAIIGGGLAGATAATELRERGYDGQLVLYAAEAHLPYERPPLSKGFLLGKEPIEKAYVHDRAWYDDHDVHLRLGSAVTGIDLARHVLHVGGAEESFTQAVLATGARPRRFVLADQGPTPTAYLRTIEDSERLKAAFAPGVRIAVVGAGWIGLEVTAAAREAGCEVTVFEQAELPLARVLGPDVATVFADLHRSHGVDLRLATSVTDADLAAADLVVVGVGVEPDTALADAAGLEVDNGVLVDATLRSSHADVFAIGDIANHAHPTLGARVRVEHWNNALQQGKTVAHNLLGDDEAYDRLPYFFTDQYDLGMEYWGHVGPEGYDTVEIEGDTGAAFRAFWIRDGVVVAAMHANDWDASDEVKATVGTARG